MSLHPRQPLRRSQSAWLRLLALLLALAWAPLSLATAKTEPTNAQPAKKQSIKKPVTPKQGIKKPVVKKQSVKKPVSQKKLSRKKATPDTALNQPGSKKRRASKAAPHAAKKPARQKIGTAKASKPRPAAAKSAPATPNLRSHAVLVLDQQTQEVLYRKNDNLIVPIASLTKLMTGLIISEAHLPMTQAITITAADVDTERHSGSRLPVGSTLSRGELLHLALMSSENRAAHALARTAFGSTAAFVAKMNAKARELGMTNTVYVEPTGLSSGNRSNATDLAKLVNAAYRQPLLRKLSTSPRYAVDIGQRVLQFNNTNRLVNNPNWYIGLQKTGYISEAGYCLVMQTKLGQRKLIMVFLDSEGSLSRIADAQRVRRWLQQTDQTLAQAKTPTANS